MRLLVSFLFTVLVSLVSCNGASESILPEPSIPKNQDSITNQDSIVFDVSKIMNVGAHPNSYYTQSMSVYGDTAFVFYTNGYCRIFDLKNRKLLKETVLASQSTNNHVNSSMFSNVFYDEEDKFPLLYVSPYGYQTCYVERYHKDENTFELIQTIKVNTSKYNKEYGEFVVDEDKGLLYCITFPSTKADNSHIKIFNLPDINNKQVTLTDNDLLTIKVVKLDFANILQGAYYHNGYIYMIFGWPETRQQFYRVDTDSFNYCGYDFSGLFNGIEPEGISLYKDSFVICTNYPAAIWKLFKVINYTGEN